MRRVLPLIALLLAGCASQPQTPVSSADDKTSQAFSTYLAARARHALADAGRCRLALNSSGCQGVVANDAVLVVVDHRVGPGGSGGGRLKCVTG